MYSFDGMRVLVVGGSSGIGLGTAKVAFEAGADVTIAGRSEERLAGAAKAIGGNVTTAVLDATDDAAVTDYFAGSGAWNHVAVTIGKGGRGLIQDLDMATAYAAMDAKFWPYFRIARAAEIVTGGSLTFVTGGLGQRPAPAASVLSAVNAAVEGLTRGLAVELGPDGVTCNAIAPGYFATELNAALVEDPEFNQFVCDRTPLGRWGDPAELGGAAVFLASPAGAYVNGHLLVIDGGMTVKL